MFIFYLFIFIYYFFISNKIDDRFNTSNTYYFLFIALFLLQRAPVVILMFVIILYKETKPTNVNQFEEYEEEENEEHLPNMDDGPNGRAKLFLIFATIFNVCGDFPLEVWSDLLPTGCPLYFASYVDLFLFFYIVSLVFFFLFLRAEYERKKEECMWQFVSKFQDDFNFKRF